MLQTRAAAGSFRVLGHVLQRLSWTTAPWWPSRPTLQRRVSPVNRKEEPSASVAPCRVLARAPICAVDGAAAASCAVCIVRAQLRAAEARAARPRALVALAAWAYGCGATVHGTTAVAEESVYTKSAGSVGKGLAAPRVAIGVDSAIGSAASVALDLRVDTRATAAFTCGARRTGLAGFRAGVLAG